MPDGVFPTTRSILKVGEVFTENKMKIVIISATLINIRNLSKFPFSWINICHLIIRCSARGTRLKYSKTRKLSAARIHSRFGSARDDADGASGAINVI